jgi:hypothetical protein
MTSPRQLISWTILVLVVSALLGILTIQRTRGARAQTEVVRLSDSNSTTTREEKSQRTDLSPAPVDKGEEVVGVEADLIKAQTENKVLQAKLQETESRIAHLEQQIKTAEEKPAATITPEPVSAAELQAELAEAKKQLDAAERENALLANKFNAIQERPAKAKKQTRPPASGNPGIRGRILAVNQAYNFCVLDLGGRQGVEPNAEMLVVRGTTLIGRIRVSSVEPATTIGDIITTSLARGVQVQPGDAVIYAGTNFQP